MINQTIRIFKASNKKNAWMLILDGKKIQGGQRGKEKIWGKMPNKARYFLRHPDLNNAKSIKQYINAYHWNYGSQIGKAIPVTTKLKKLIDGYRTKNSKE